MVAPAHRGDLSESETCSEHPTKLGYTHTHTHTHVHIYTRLLRDSEESRKSRKLAHRQAQDLWQDLKLQGPQENQPKTLVGKSMIVEGCGSREERSHELGVDSPARHPTLSPGTMIQPHPPHTESSPWLPLPGTLTHFLKWMPPWSPLRRLHCISAVQPAPAWDSSGLTLPTPHPTHTLTHVCASCPGIQQSWPGTRHPFPTPQGTPCLLPSSLPGPAPISSTHL